MKTAISLRKRIFTAITSSLLVFLLAEFGFLLANKYQQDTETLFYVDEVLSNTERKLKDMDKRLSLVGGSLSVHPALAEVAGLRPSVQVDNESMERAFEVIYMAVNASSEIVDITLVNQAGQGRSYVAGWGYQYIPELSVRYDFTDLDSVAPEYFFIQQVPESDRGLFFLVVPLWDMRQANRSAYGSPLRVGSIVVACDLYAMVDLLNYGPFRPYSLSILAGRDDHVIAQFASRPHQGDIVRNHYVEDLNVTIRFEGETSRFFLSPVFVASVVLILLFILVSQLMLNKLMRENVLQPIAGLSDDMLSIRGRTRDTRLMSLGIEELDPIVNSANSMLDSIDEAGEQATKAKLDHLEAQLHRNEAERYALQSQINPHFLFNTLQCIRALAIAHQAEDVASITNAMADLTRYAISSGDRVTLGDEVDIIKKYLGIIDVRYQQRITYRIDVPGDLLRISCIKMMLQPLVENAVTHGLSMLPQGGEVRISARLVEGDALVEVCDNGRGISPETLRELHQTLGMELVDLLKDSRHRSYGLYNIHRRMQITYGKKYGLSIITESGWTKLTLKLPIHYS